MDTFELLKLPLELIEIILLGVDEDTFMMLYDDDVIENNTVLNQLFNDNLFWGKRIKVDYPGVDLSKFVNLNNRQIWELLSKRSIVFEFRIVLHTIDTENGDYVDDLAPVPDFKSLSVQEKQRVLDLLKSYISDILIRQIQIIGKSFFYSNLYLVKLNSNTGDISVTLFESRSDTPIRYSLTGLDQTVRTVLFHELYNINNNNTIRTYNTNLFNDEDDTEIALIFDIED